MENYIGEIRMYAGTKPPANWAICDGSLISVQDYYELFMMIGTTYGGDGHSSFAVPDLRSRTPIGVGAGPGLTPIALNQRVGAEFSTINPENLPAHTHLLRAVKSPANNMDPSKLMMATALTDNSIYVKDAAPVPPRFAMAAASISSTGSATVNVPIMQPFMAINFIVSLKGFM